MKLKKLPSTFKKHQLAFFLVIFLSHSLLIPNPQAVEALNVGSDPMEHIIKSIESFSKIETGRIYYISQGGGGLYQRYYQVIEFSPSSIKSRGSSSNFESYQELNFLKVGQQSFITRNTLLGVLSKVGRSTENLLDIPNARIGEEIWLEVDEKSQNAVNTVARNFINSEILNGARGNIKSNFYIPALDEIVKTTKLSEGRYLIASKDRDYIYTINPNSLTLSVHSKGYKYFFKLQKESREPRIPAVSTKLI